MEDEKAIQQSQELQDEIQRLSKSGETKKAQEVRLQGQKSRDTFHVKRQANVALVQMYLNQWKTIVQKQIELGFASPKELESPEDEDLKASQGHTLKLRGPGEIERPWWPTLPENQKQPSNETFAQILNRNLPEMRMPKRTISEGNQCKPYTKLNNAVVAKSTPYQNEVYLLADSDQPADGYFLHWGTGAGKSGGMFQAIRKRIHESKTEKLPIERRYALLLLPTEKSFTTWASEEWKVFMSDITVHQKRESPNHSTIMYEVDYGFTIVFHKMSAQLPEDLYELWNPQSTNEYVLPHEYDQEPYQTGLDDKTKRVLQKDMKYQIEQVLERRVALPPGGLVGIDEIHDLIDPIDATRNKLEALTVLSWCNVIHQREKHESDQTLVFGLTATMVTDDAKFPNYLRSIRMLRRFKSTDSMQKDPIPEGVWRRVLPATVDATSETKELRACMKKADDLELTQTVLALWESDASGRPVRWRNKKAILEHLQGLFSYVTLENDPTVYPRIETQGFDGSPYWRFNTKTKKLEKDSNPPFQTEPTRGVIVRVPLNKSIAADLQKAMKKDLDSQSTSGSDVKGEVQSDPYSNIKYSQIQNASAVQKEWGLKIRSKTYPHKVYAMAELFRLLDKDPTYQDSRRFIYSSAKNFREYGKPMIDFFTNELDFELVGVMEIIPFLKQQMGKGLAKTKAKKPSSRKVKAKAPKVESDPEDDAEEQNEAEGGFSSDSKTKIGGDGDDNEDDTDEEVGSDEKEVDDSKRFSVSHLADVWMEQHPPPAKNRKRFLFFGNSATLDSIQKALSSTGFSLQLIRDLMMAIFNHPMNLQTGNYIKYFAGDRTSKQSLSLKQTLVMIRTSPAPNKTTELQSRDRTRRYCSMEGISDNSLWKTQIFTLVSCWPDEISLGRGGKSVGESGSGKPHSRPKMTNEEYQLKFLVGQKTYTSIFDEAMAEVSLNCPAMKEYNGLMRCYGDPSTNGSDDNSILSTIAAESKARTDSFSNKSLTPSLSEERTHSNDSKWDRICQNTNPDSPMCYLKFTNRYFVNEKDVTYEQFDTYASLNYIWTPDGIQSLMSNFDIHQNCQRQMGRLFHLRKVGLNDLIIYKAISWMSENESKLELPTPLPKLESWQRAVMCLTNPNFRYLLVMRREDRERMKLILEERLKSLENALGNILNVKANRMVLGWTLVLQRYAWSQLLVPLLLKPTRYVLLH